jgi:ribonucleoside-diphosphate reductase alpha chain
MESGEPYLWFIDAANRALPPFQKKLGLVNRGSNLCSEISLATNDDRTFVCCLSSVNLEKYDEWKDNEQFIADVVEMLDNVIDVFCKKAKQYPELSRAIKSAQSERSIGIGAMGWHALLQSKMIPFESALAVGLNKQIWSKMNEQAKRKTIELARERGPCPDSADSDTPVRNAHLFAIAPNASSSIILNTSPSIEPYRANVYLEKGVNGTKVHRNKYLEAVLEKNGCNTQATWTEIVSNDGSVQSIDCLSDYEKDVFKTAPEIDQMWLIQHAADRQPYVCQAQSLNLFFSPTSNVEYLHLVHLAAWKQGLKSLYYCRSDAMRKADKVGKRVERERIEDMKDMLKSDEPTCVACEG